MRQTSFLILIVSILFTEPVFAKEAALVVTLTPTNPVCGKFNGRIVVAVSGGTAPYSYSLNGNPPQPSNVFLYLGPGVYNITVTDAAAQSGSASATLTNQFTAPTGVTATSTPVSGCTGSNGSLTLTGTGGTPPYMYSIDRTNYQASNIFPNLYAGSYWLGLKDANGCISPFVLITSQVNGTCSIHHNGINESSICNPFQSNLELMNVSGGTPPYLYSLDGVNFQSNPLFFPLPAGLHTVTVKDAAGLILKFTVALQSTCSSPYNLASTVTPAQCGVNGTITVDASLGIAPYTYSIDGVNFQSSNQFTGLAPGNYTITVKDADGVTTSIFCMVKNACISATASSTSSTCGLSNGSIVVQGAGGVPPYEYAIGSGAYSSVNQFNNLAASTYVIHVRDATGATWSFNQTVNGIAGPVVNTVVPTPASCTLSNGTITVGAQNGTAPLQYSIDGINFQSSAFFSGVAAGSYTTTVKDAAGCMATASVTVAMTNNLTANAGASQVICEGQSVALAGSSNGTIIAWTPVTGLSNPAVLNPVASPIITTDYTLTVTSGTCTAVSVTRVTVNPLPLAVVGNDLSICLGKNGQLIASGGVSYRWSPGTYLNDPTMPAPSVINAPAGNYQYSVNVTDNNGCVSINPAVVKVNVYTVQVSAGPDADVQSGNPLQLQAVDFNSYGFTQYSWSPSTGLSDPFRPNPVATLTNDINYTLTATTAAGCTASDNISVKVYHNIDIYVPTAFTPNGDGKNDLLKAIPAGIREFRFFTVYDRAGQMMFHTTQPSTGWNGEYKGASLTGVFVWMAEGVDLKGRIVSRKGTVVIIR